MATALSEDDLSAYRRKAEPRSGLTWTVPLPELVLNPVVPIAAADSRSAWLLVLSERLSSPTLPVSSDDWQVPEVMDLNLARSLGGPSTYACASEPGRRRTSPGSQRIQFWLRARSAAILPGPETSPSSPATPPSPSCAAARNEAALSAMPRRPARLRRLAWSANCSSACCCLSM